jgi:hypothetical protein
MWLWKSLIASVFGLGILKLSDGSLPFSRANPKPPRPRPVAVDVASPEQPAAATAEMVESQASQTAMQQQLFARRRRRRASLLVTMGMGDTSTLPSTLPTAVPFTKTTLGG